MSRHVGSSLVVVVEQSAHDRSKHSDNLNNLVIASVSLGAERTFIMSPREPSKNARGRAGRLKDDGQRNIDIKDLRDRKSLKWK